MVVKRSKKQVLNSSRIDAADRSHVEMNANFGNDRTTLLEFIGAQRTDTYFIEVRQYVELPDTAFIHDREGILVRKASIDGATQKWCRHQ